jgi:hypothetical protein
LGGVERGWSLRSTPGDSDRGRTCRERGGAACVARNWGDDSCRLVPYRRSCLPNGAGGGNGGSDPVSSVEVGAPSRSGRLDCPGPLRVDNLYRVGPICKRKSGAATGRERGTGEKRTDLRAQPRGHFALTPALSHSHPGSASRESFCGRGGTRAAVPLG